MWQLLTIQENDGNKVVQDLILGPHEKDVVFLKHMGKHFIDLDGEFLDITQNVRGFLISSCSSFT